MKKFSVEIDRSFEIGGELFKWRQPYWEDYANQMDTDMSVAQAALDALTRTNGDEISETKEEETKNETVHSSVSDLIKRIEMFIDPENDSLNRWRKLAKRKIDPVALYQFRELYEWLVGVTTGRPPTEPLSPDGPEPTEPTSKDASS